MSYDMIDRFLRNNLDDNNYAEYSAALDELCTPPAQRTYPQAERAAWVGLTVDEIVELVKRLRDAPVALADAIEAKLKEKNT